MRLPGQRRHSIDELMLNTLSGNKPLLTCKSAQQLAFGCAIPVSQQHGGIGVWALLQQGEQLNQQGDVFAL